ncbi:unnamed protein product [Durusdinium trenchii]|uniref:Translocation protein SEC63 homolog n=2 Tax=Durusdinium trenchii TaxID=1381693 RepID=A0ABP0J7D8_9DINO
MPQWEVIGGSGTGGILVRQGQELKSPQLEKRLETGSIVEELRLVGERLHYRLLRGAGPPEGWVSLKVSGKVLLSPLVEAETASAKDESFDKWQVLGVEAGSEASKNEAEMRRISAQKILSASGRPYAVLGLQAGASSAATRRAYHCLALLHHPDKGGDDAVFKAIADAYKALTEAKTEEGGWRDLEGQAVGPWQGHAPTATKGITCMLFDTFGTPPWESRRLYTGLWPECLRSAFDVGSFRKESPARQSLHLVWWVKLPWVDSSMMLRPSRPLAF